MSDLRAAHIGEAATHRTPLDWDKALQAACAHAPYLAALAARDGDFAQQILRDGAPRAAADAIARARPETGEESFEATLSRLRIAKRHAHLAIAVADLAGAWTLEDVTGALSDLADASVRAALWAGVRQLAERGQIAPAHTPDDPAPGFIIIAMGKHGARELNYSSDIDFSIFFDADRLPVLSIEARPLAVRLTQAIVRALEEVTADGYVFRTDLRLRPDPASTPVAVSLSMAENYYQSVGQNWERAAFIKARPCAGDIAAGEAFLRTLRPFIWRRNLDYAAISDVHSIKRQILAQHNRAALGSGVFDVKLGRGGIRDIELFAQTQQLILGGRDSALRVRGTKEALGALRNAGRVAVETEHALCAAYDLYRAVEHRIQMLRDEQTHTVPASPEDRERLAALSGYACWDDLDHDLAAHRAAVAAIDAKLFAAEESLADPLGSLVFTGVEDDPETLETLRQMGFDDPARVSATVRGWHHGRIRATRSERAREILTAIMPKLLRAIAETAEADQAFVRFDDFLTGLPAGVQVLALLRAHPALLKDLADVMGLAPKMAHALSRRPALLDAMVDPAFARALDEDAPAWRRAALHRLLAGAPEFEASINAARRFHREEALRITVQTLQGRTSARTAGQAHTDLADACVDALAEVALQEVARLHGQAPGRFVVVGLGSFGAREMTAGSDLDVMLIYDAPEGAESSGPRALAAGEYYAKLTQRLVSALSAPTEEGELYDVDMNLRPSGAKGPVAVRLSSFAHYYAHDAWTWELMALTRARIVAGDEILGAEVMQAARDALAADRASATVRADARAMRALMDKERPGRGLWDLKLAPGGLVDIEFIAQTLSLEAGLQAPATARALERLRDAGALGADDDALLSRAHTLQADLHQLVRIGADDILVPARASGRLKDLLARAAGEASFDALEARLAATQAQVRAALERLLGAPATDPAV